MASNNGHAAVAAELLRAGADVAAVDWVHVPACNTDVLMSWLVRFVARIPTSALCMRQWTRGGRNRAH